jgi:hypothetical protein
LNWNGNTHVSSEMCIERSFPWSDELTKFCTELKDGALEGLCQCVDEGVARLLHEKAEICFPGPLKQSQKDMLAPKWLIKELQELERSYPCRCHVYSSYALFWK